MKTPLLKIYKARFLALCMGLALLSSCAQLNYLDRAQDSFSKGAEIENRQLFGVNLNSDPGAAGNISDAVQQELTSISPRFYYSQAYAEIQKAVQKAPQLQKDDLLGNALSIKALCEWKLKYYGKARTSAGEALVAFSASEVPSPRDQAVMIALDGFIENDMAYNALGELETKIDNAISDRSPTQLEAMKLFDDIKSFYKQNIISENGNAKIEKAIELIQKAKDQLSATHSLQSYLIMSQLACVKNWSDALNTIESSLKSLGLNDNGSSPRKWFDGEVDKYEASKEGLLEELASKLSNQKSHPAYQQWEELLF
ncbi:MAG: hypothetical protein AAFO07_22280 [Bacteroidota bacterium]